MNEPVLRRVWVLKIASFQGSGYLGSQFFRFVSVLRPSGKDVVTPLCWIARLVVFLGERKLKRCGKSVDESTQGGPNNLLGQVG